MSDPVHVYHHRARPFRALLWWFAGFLIGGMVVAAHVGPAAPTPADVQAYCASHHLPR
jgi:hypothetical protein